MGRKRITRTPLRVSNEADVIEIAPVRDWLIDVESGDPIHANYVSNIHAGEQVLSQLNLFLRGQSKKRAAANVLLRYLKYVASFDGALGANSLKGYRDALDNNATVDVNTKSQLFGSAVAFVERQIEVGLVPPQTLPRNFRKQADKSHPSFAEIAGEGMYEALEPCSGEIEKAMSSHRLDRVGAAALVYCEAALRAIRQSAHLALNCWEMDWAFSEQAISALSASRIAELKRVDDFSDVFGDKRSVEEAHLIIFAKFGKHVPASEFWPPGVADFLRARGWSVGNVRAAISGHGEKKDVDFVRRLIKETPKAKLLKLAEIVDYSRKETDVKSIELALQVLFSRFGRALPGSPLWPRGLADYLKFRGWSAERVSSTFFPNSRIHGYLLLATLAHEDLAPNVDSVLFYAYLDAFKPSSEPGMISVHFGKKRGGPVAENLDQKDPLCIAYRQYVDILKNCLLSIPEGKTFLEKEFCPIFLHVHQARGKAILRTYSPCSSSDIARRAISQFSESNPILLPLVGKATGQNFRPTIAVIDKLRNRPVGAIKRRLRHKKWATTDRYVDRVEAGAVLRNKSLEFQNYIVGEAKSLKYTGSGYKCAKDDQGNFSNVDCHGPSMCSECDARRIVLADVQLAAQWVAWNREIVASEERLKFENPERWDQHWSVRQVEYTELLTMCSPSVRKQAEALAVHIKLPYLD